MSYVAKSVFAPLPQAKRGVPLILKGDPKGKNFLYTNGKSVIIRDIEKTGISDIYTQHSVDATVACYAPSGFYIASGDVSGKIRIWDTTQKEHILKYEYQPISGAIKDIVWSPDSKRIAVCGDGREKFGHIFLWDSGSSVGEISGHSKLVNAIDYRPTRPFRVVTAGEDKQVGWYEGPPFKLKTMIQDNTRFVNIVRFSPNGELFCSGSADGKATLYDGKTAEKKAVLGGDTSHAGGINCLTWNPDGRQVLTASGDKTCKLWDVETSQVVNEFKMGSQVEDQQVSCLWQGPHILSVSVSGCINYLDLNNPEKPLRILKGQNRNLYSLAISKDNSTIFAGSLSGRINHWDIETGDVDLVSGPGHTNLVASLVATPERLHSIGLDKSVRTSSTSTYEFDSKFVALPDLDPIGLDLTLDGLAVAVTKTEIVLSRDGDKVGTMPVSYEPTCVTCSPSQPEVAVGGKDNCVHIYTVDGDKLTEKTKIQASADITAAAYSPDGAYLAVSMGRNIKVYETASFQEKHDFLKHTARVMCLSWSPDSKLIVSGSIDTTLCVWSLEKNSYTTMIKNAHPLSVVSAVAWISDTCFASACHNAIIRVWEFTS